MSENFYRRNAWWLGTGVLMMFGSSFGQTYFIALFAGVFREEFGLTNGEWGGLYTIGTITSAMCLIAFGRLTDTVPIRQLTTAILILYAGAALIASQANGALLLVIAVFGLRFCGQGMMTLIAMTAIARWFRANRARAVAIAVMGFPLGEAIFPFIGVSLIAAIGWRNVWVLVAVVLLVVFLPATLLLLRRNRAPQGEGGAETTLGMDGKHWTRKEVVRHWSFWILLPGLLAPPFIGTCVFFHQVHIAQVRGFDLATMTIGFPIYAAISISSALAAGSIIDKIGVTRLLPLLLLPLGLAILPLAMPGGVWVWFVTLSGVGVSQGFVITMMGTLWPTLYGTQWIGSVKSLSNAAMVVATAVGPGVTGAAIDFGYSFPEQAIALATYCAVISAVLVVAAPKLGARLTRELPQAA